MAQSKIYNRFPTCHAPPIIRDERTDPVKLGFGPNFHKRSIWCQLVPHEVWTQLVRSKPNFLLKVFKLFKSLLISIYNTGVFVCGGAAFGPPQVPGPRCNFYLCPLSHHLVVKGHFLYTYHYHTRSKQGLVRVG